MTPEHEYLRIGEAAQYLGVSAGTLRNWERSGMIPTYRHPVNNYRLYRREDLDVILRQIAESYRGPSSQAAPRYPDESEMVEGDV